MNRPSAKISMEGMEYPMERDNRFKIIYKENRNLTISLISFDDERIDFHEIDLDNHTSEIVASNKETMLGEFTTESRFVNYVMQRCWYLAENHIYNKGAYKPNKFMKWHIFKVDVDQNGTAQSERVYYSNEKQNFTIYITHPNFNISFSLSPSATVFSAAFKYLEVIMKPNFPIKNNTATISKTPQGLHSTILETFYKI